MIDDQIADTLDATADLLEPPDRWLQGPEFEGDPDGGCVVTATGKAAATWVGRLAARHALARSLGCPEDVPIVGFLTHWNDDPARTKQEVLDALRLAAKEARS